MLKERNIYQEVITTVDENGVVKKTEEKKVVSLPKEPPYVKLYIDDLSKILSLPQNCSNIMYEVVKQITFDGYVTVTKATRDRMARNLKTTEQTIRNNIARLSKIGILKHTGYCEYEMNPNLFAKGDWIDIYKRRQSFQLTVTYSKDGDRTLKGEAI